MSSTIDVDKQYWLGDAVKTNGTKTVFKVKLVDGPHIDPKGVKEAEQIIKRIGLDRGLTRQYVMVCIENIPDVEVKLNDEMIEQNKIACDLYHSK